MTDVRIISPFVQIENLLISNQGTIKLCDFGSSTTVSHYPDYSWSAQKRSMVEDEVCIHTHTHTLTLSSITLVCWCFCK